MTVTEGIVTQSDQGGLRERKKRATREALHDAALRLTLEHGLEHLTVEEISAAAEVSPRTFFNYFPGKEQAIVGDDLFAADARQVSEIMAGAASVLDGMQAVALDLAAAAATRREQVQLRWQVITRYPALITAMFARLEEFNTVVACAVAARLGCAPDDTLSAAHGGHDHDGDPGGRPAMDDRAPGRTTGAPHGRGLRPAQGRARGGTRN